MDCEVVVVGGGIGGLTIAALLAARGVDVCLLERESRVGGCAAGFEKFGYSFEQGDGLYRSWQPNEIHARVFSELPLEPPEVRLSQPAYAVRLPDQSEISLTSNTEEFEQNLRVVFPECANRAISFYRDLAPLSSALRRVLQRTPDFFAASRARQTFALLSEGLHGVRILKARRQTALDRLEGLSFRFRNFVDVQLQALGQGTSAEVSCLYAAAALSSSREGMFAIRGGAAALAETLAECIRLSGGKVRLNAPVLRLAYDSRDYAVGVDLLSGEAVTASKAIISNLTIWDTYGRLVGLNRTPTNIRKQLKSQGGWGAYLMYLGMDEDQAPSLAQTHFLTFAAFQDSTNFDPENNQLLFSAAPSWDTRAPAGKRAVTVHAYTDVESWFTFHQDDTELEEQDQRMLEACWARLHAAMPELGSSVEVIDTATPRSFYDLTRRKLGIVGGAPATPAVFWPDQPSHLTSLPNLFIISDTVSAGGIAGLTHSALALANLLTK